MKLCRVLGPVVATRKHPAFEGRALLVVPPLSEDGTPEGQSFLALDAAQAGRGDVVLVLREGNGVRQVLGDASLPIRSLVVGIVDRVDVDTAEAGR